MTRRVAPDAPANAVDGEPVLLRVPVPDADPAVFARVACTGRFGLVDRERIQKEVESRGGRMVSGVSRRTTMLVVGSGGWPVLRDGSVSRTLLRAEDLVAGGAVLAIVSELDFLRRIGDRSGAGDRAPRAPHFTRTGACALLGIDVPTLRRWEAFGLIETTDGTFDFRDLVSLRTIARLMADGVAPTRISAAVKRLGVVLATARPLAQLSLVADDGDLRAEVAGALVAPDGQLYFSFDGSFASEAAQQREQDDDHEAADHGDAPASVLARVVPTSAEGWFERGRMLEDLDELEGARDAYTHAIAATGVYPEAHFNLGNVLRACGDPARAEAHYRRATEQDRAFAEAWYNLADLQEEAGRIADAARSLECAVAADPQYADALFNLAACCELTGQLDDAAEYWRQYCRLDPQSHWADEARRRLAQLAPLPACELP